MRNRANLRILTSAFLCAMVFLASQIALSVCQASSANPQGPFDESTLKIGLIVPIDSFNPFIGLTESSKIYFGLVYDGLQSVGDNLESVPNLATSWRQVPTSDLRMQASGEPLGSVWEYKLTRNATWHDGVPFTAKDVVFTVNLQTGLNYDTMWSNQPTMYYIDRAEMIDNYTVWLHFHDRSTGDPLPVAFGGALCFPIVAEHVLKDLPPPDISFSWDGSPVIGTGPYGFESVNYDTGSVTLLRNPYYHAAADRGVQTKVDRIVLKIFDDDSSLYSALKLGEVQLAKFENEWTFMNATGDISSGRVPGVATFTGLSPNQMRSYISICMNQGGPNPSRLDPTIRQAMSMATNKSYILSNFRLGYGQEGSTLVSPLNAAWHYEPSFAEQARFGYNISAAAALLESHGYIDVDSDGVRECTIASAAVQKGYVSDGRKLAYELVVGVDYPTDYNVALYLKSQWLQLGVVVNPNRVDGNSLLAIVYSYAYDLAMLSSSCDPDPNLVLFTQSMISWNGWSDNKYTNASMEENYTRSVSALNHADRETYVDNCQRTHFLDIGYIILTYSNQMIAWNAENFTGWGDWQAKPGRSICSYWGANPLLFGLEPTNYTLGSTKAIPDKHISILVPRGWTFDRNFSVATAFYDLGLNATSLGTYRAIAYMSTYPWSGDVTDDKLSALADEIIAQLGSGFTLGYELISQPSALTVDEHRAVEFTVKANAGAVFVVERVVILASSETSLAWAFFFAAPESMYPSISTVFEAIVDSITIQAIESRDEQSLIIVGTLVAVVTAAILVFVVFMLRRKEASPPAAPPTGS